MADKDKDPTDPTSTSSAYDTMMSRWHLVSALMGGTEAMRMAGETYLPRHSEETDYAYTARLQKTTLNNMFEETLNSLSGKPFAENVKLGKNIPEKVLPWLDNVDLTGNQLAVFLRDWFTIGLSKAFCHVLVDMPRIDPKADGTPRTVADDATEQMRPYLVLVRPENVLFIEETNINGVPTVTHVRILEEYTERVGFLEVCQVQVKVLEPGIVKIYRPIKANKSSGKIKWYVAEEWSTAWDYVPLITFYAGRRDSLMVAKPPLLDLGYMNVAHWQSTSEQRHSLMVARFPILACSGASGEDSEPVIVGPNKVLYNAAPDGKFYYVEHTGAAIEAGRLDLEQLETQMSNYGAEFLKQDPGDPTATAKAIDSAEANSSLSAIVGIFEDAVAQALSYMAKMAGEEIDTAAAKDDGGTVQLVKSFAPDLADGQGLIAVTAARAGKDLSRPNYLGTLVLRGLLPEDFDMEENDQQLEDENQKAMEAGAALMNMDPLGNPSPAPEPAPPPPGTPKPAPAPAKKVVK